MLRAFLDGKLMGTERGDAAPWLLALHGWQRSTSDFDAVLGARPDLASDQFAGAAVPSIALDLPGFGASPAPPKGWGTEEYAAALGPLLERFEQPVVVLGHSFGGRVALRLASAYPRAIRSLVLTGVPGLEASQAARRPRRAFRIIRRAAALGLVSQDRLESARERYGSSDYRSAQGVMREVLVATLQDRYDSLIAQLELPVHLVWGELDDQSPLAGARSALARLARGELLVLPGVGHLVPTEAPDALRGVLAEVETMTAIEIAAVALGAVSLALGSLRWLRVAQREHYLPGSVARFARRWWSIDWSNRTLWLLGLAGWCVGVRFPATEFVAVAVGAIGPIGLGLRGRTARLAWTRRLERLAALSGLLMGAVIAIAVVAGGLRAAALAMVGLVLVVPLLIDAGMLLAAPVEERIARAYVRRASEVLHRVRPRTVAITGSYGKTSTKGYLAHLLADRFSVVASPRSFNNRQGLARTVNELLAPGTDVLVAEMGTYGPGEISAMVSWVPPEVAVITSIGPVHLERFKSLETTLRTKREIIAGARVVVLNCDDPLLARLAGELRASQARIIGCSADDDRADVALIDRSQHFELFVAGRSLGTVDLGPARHTIAATNVACALGAAIALGVDAGELLPALAKLPISESRLVTSTGTSGVMILDDTYNSNPAGTELALRALASLATGKRVVVVTPGMVELGELQQRANSAFAAQASTLATDLVVVGRTNRRALLDGAATAQHAGSAVRVHEVRHRDDAVTFVRTELGPGDVVLYENDLPDHFP